MTAVTGVCAGRPIHLFGQPFAGNELMTDQRLVLAECFSLSANRG